MTITNSLYSFFSGTAGITAVTEDISPGFTPPQSERPALTFSVQDNQDTETLHGLGSVATALVDVDCWATSLISAEAIATAVKTALASFRTTVGTMGSHTVTHVQKTRELHLEETDTRLRRVSLQFAITYGV